MSVCVCVCVFRQIIYSGWAGHVGRAKGSDGESVCVCVCVCADRWSVQADLAWDIDLQHSDKADMIEEAGRKDSM